MYVAHNHRYLHKILKLSTSNSSFHSIITFTSFQVSVKDQVHMYKKLAELQFDSFRKCMSVIVRPKFSSEDLESSQNGQNLGQGETIYLFIKGADTAVLPNCIHGPVEETNKIVEKFAKEGLRTLVYAYKTITRDELNLFSEKLEQAKQSIVNR